MGRDRWLNPLTRDYVTDGHGGYVMTSSAQPKIYHQLKGALDKWAGDPTKGNDFDNLERKDTEAHLRAAADLVRAALAPLVKLGTIANLVVEVATDQRGRWVIVSECLDVTSGEQLNLGPMLPFGP